MFQRQELIRFQHCDPAGIVFYPRYIEMINATVEDWFASVGMDFAHIHIDEGIAIPAVSLSVDFKAASRLGDTVTFTLEVERVGRTSVTFKIVARHEAEVRFDATITLVLISKGDFRPRPWPASFRAAFERELLH